MDKPQEVSLEQIKKLVSRQFEIAAELLDIANSINKNPEADREVYVDKVLDFSKEISTVSGEAAYLAALYCSDHVDEAVAVQDMIGSASSAIRNAAYFAEIVNIQSGLGDLLAPPKRTTLN